MHIPHLLQERFSIALKPLTEDYEKFSKLVRPTNNPKMGDYQANCAMPLKKQLGVNNPNEAAQKIVDNLKVDDMCEPPEIVNGFINLKLNDKFLAEAMSRMLDDERCLVEDRGGKETIVIDFSSPNVAKPMHVGHIRSTVIGDSLARTLKFLGYNTITDNHLGDWGTQFGMIIYGYKHFGDAETVDADPVLELLKIYRLVNQLMDYRKAIASLDTVEEKIIQAKADAERLAGDAEVAEGKAAKKAKKVAESAAKRVKALEGELASAKAKIGAVDADPELKAIADAHPNIATDVLGETAKLHEGDAENLALWNKFMPHCKDEINRVYKRLDIQFDHTLGESFYHSMLGDVVEQLQADGTASESEGAICVFLPNFDAPMIVRKQDGAYLYATTDLATLKYRLAEFSPSEILYVVDTRQSEHFEKLFAVAKKMGLDEIKLAHVNFGTVLGEDGRPMKTKSGDLIGLESLLDDAVDRAKQVVCDPERLTTFDPPMDVEEQHHVAEVVGIGAIKFADLAHHRTSDYRFNLEKMVDLNGATSAYIQFSFARVNGILRKAETSEEEVITNAKEQGIEFTHSAERDLALAMLRFEESLVSVHNEYAPNLLVEYLLDTAKQFSIFVTQCHVLKAETPQAKTCRLALVFLYGRVCRLALNLLGINVLKRM